MDDLKLTGSNFYDSESNEDSELQKLFNTSLNGILNINNSTSGAITTNATNWLSTQSAIYTTTESLHENFAKYTKHLSEKDLEKMLDLMKEDDRDLYISALSNLLKHYAFRQLSEQFLLERISDINMIEEDNSGFKLSNFYDLDKYPSVKLIKKIN